jgi:acylphosphatase
MIRNRVIVSGDVQGVCFRDSCRRAAVGFRAAGWVRNLADGTVEAVFEGAADAVEKMVAWSQRGPPLATVARVLVVEEPPEGLSGFRILPTPW